METGREGGVTVMTEDPITVALDVLCSAMNRAADRVQKYGAENAPESARDMKRYGDAINALGHIEERVQGLIESQREPDPEAAQILEDNLWELANDRTDESKTIRHGHIICGTAGADNIPTDYISRMA